jgi:predicted CoA-binding protein
MRTLIVGATPNPERYAYLAAKNLLKHGYEIELFGIKKGNIDGHEILNDLDQIKDIDTVTMYVGPKNQPPYYEGIINLRPRRVIFNPGTENPEFYHLLRQQHIEIEVACTLVMLAARTY